MPLTAVEYDDLRSTGGTIFAEGCGRGPRLADVVVPDRARVGIGPDVDLAEALRRRVAMPVRDEGLPVEGAPAG